MTQKTHKASIFLWYDGAAEEAARFYVDTFPDSAMGRISYAALDNPGCKVGEPLLVEFTVCGLPFT